MVKNILIIGLNQINSGKTYFARSLLTYLREQEYRVSGFKPFSSNNIWHNYDHIHMTLSEGKIYGNDALLLKKESNVNVREESLNPIHRIWSEPETIDQFTRLPNFIIDRISMMEKEKEKNVILINKDNIKLIPKKFIKKINEIPYKQHIINDSIELNRFIKYYYRKAVRTKYDLIKKYCDFIIIESYSNKVFSNWNGLNHFDKIIAVKPWNILIYDPFKYEKALELSKPIYSWEISSDKIKDLIKPTKIIKIKPNKSENIIHYLQSKIPLILDFQ